MRNFWQSEFPIGCATRGAPYGERTDPATIALVSTVASGVGAVSTVAGLFGGDKKSAPPPVVSAPTLMPTPDDDAMKLAKKKALAGQVARRGRQSTVLEDDTSGDLLGG